MSNLNTDFGCYECTCVVLQSNLKCLLTPLISTHSSPRLQPSPTTKITEPTPTPRPRPLPPPVDPHHPTINHSSSSTSSLRPNKQRPGTSLGGNTKSRPRPIANTRDFECLDLGQHVLPRQITRQLHHSGHVQLHRKSPPYTSRSYTILPQYKGLVATRRTSANVLAQHCRVYAGSIAVQCNFTFFVLCTSLKYFAAWELEEMWIETKRIVSRQNTRGPIGLYGRF